MKKLLLFTTLVILYSWVLAQNKINAAGEQCSHCNMLIKDPLFASVAVSDDQQLAFDAIECMVNFLKDHEEAEFAQLLVADYSNGGEFTDARSATYLKSKGIPSPMGAYISAYSSREAAVKVKNDKGGKLYDWEGLKELFKDSRFGLLNQPTHHHHSPGAYAPIGIMGDHLHHKGGFMISLRYMDMRMEGNLEGSSETSNMDIFQEYMVAPQSMTMRMYMLGAMYAPSDKLTLMVMQNFVNNSMELQSMMGMMFSTSSAGLGDMKIAALYGVMATETSSFHLNTSINIPVGDIENRDNTPMMENMKLPYPMQLGSGTWDFSLGGTYKASRDKLSWGLQPIAVLRVGENSEGYRFGNQFDVNGWISYDLFSFMSFSGRVLTSTLGTVNGMDEDLNPMMAPPANASNTGFTRVRSFLGTNISFGHQPFWRDFKLGLEYGIPLYQEVNGVQMSEEATLLAGLRYSL